MGYTECMQKRTRDNVIRLGRAGCSVEQIAELTNCTLDGIERELADAGINYEALERRIEDVATKAGWGEKIDAMTTTALDWAQNALETGTDDKLKLALLKVLMEHRPDKHFSRSAKVQVESTGGGGVIGGAELSAFRKAAAASAVPEEVTNVVHL